MIIRDMPFIWRLKDDWLMHQPAVPLRMDFEWDWDERLGLLKQRVTPALRAALAAVYAAGSANLGATESYGEDFWQFVSSHFNRPKVLEIGPGSGWLAERMGAAGAEVFVHEGPFPDHKRARVYHQQHGPRIKEQRTGNFDLIVAHHVLEHVEDPVGFLQGCKDLLAQNGEVIVAVPDCSRSIEMGDISIATHQHLSYFTYNSLAMTFAAAGLSAYGITRVKGSLFHRAHRYSNDALGHLPQGSFGQFATSATYKQRYIGDFIAFAGLYPGDTGIVVPMRALPYVPSWEGCFFDDGMAGKFLDGVGRQILPLSAIEQEGVRYAFVMSVTHERQIVDTLAGRCKVITLKEMLNA